MPRCEAGFERQGEATPERLTAGRSIEPLVLDRRATLIHRAGDAHANRGRVRGFGRRRNAVAESIPRRTEGRQNRLADGLSIKEMVLRTEARHIPLLRTDRGTARPLPDATASRERLLRTR